MKRDLWSALTKNIRSLFYDKEVVEDASDGVFTVSDSNAAILNSSKFLKEKKDREQFEKIANRSIERPDSGASK